MKLCHVAFIGIFFAVCVCAQQAGTTSKPLTDQRIIELVRAGLSANELARLIATAPEISFDLTPAAEDQMMKAGVSEDTIKLMAAREIGTVAVDEQPVSTPYHNPVQPAKPVENVENRPTDAGWPTNKFTMTRLTDEQVTQAIQQGLASRHRIGLTLNDLQTSMTGRCFKCNHASGFTISIYRPAQWIEEVAAQAKRDMRPYSISDVSEQMRQSYLHVIALPSTPDYLNARGLARSSSVKRIVLCDTSRQVTIQPIELAHDTIQLDSALRSAQLASAQALFPMSSVARLRQLDPKREFFVVIIGDHQDKWFKVKAKFHF